MRFLGHATFCRTIQYLYEDVINQDTIGAPAKEGWRDDATRIIARGVYAYWLGLVSDLTANGDTKTHEAY